MTSCAAELLARSVRTISGTVPLLGLAVGWALFDGAHEKIYAAGATTPFATIEVESGTLGGGAYVSSIAPGMPKPTAATVETEASGYALVHLVSVGDSVTLTNNTGIIANTIVVRVSIPDATNGGGITATLDMYVNGVFRQTVTVSSAQAWEYRSSTGLSKTPGSGPPHHFYNEFPVWVSGAAIAPGSTITLQKDSGNTAAYYNIDCIDLENVPAPLAQPANSLSVISYGADPNFTADSTTAIQNCVNDAKTRGMSVWIPPGKYMINSLSGIPLNFTGATVNGAGMWYSILYRNVPLPAPSGWRSEILVGSGTTLTDVQIDSDATLRGIGGAYGDDYGINASGAAGWLVNHLWTRHGDANWLSGSNATIENSRTADSYGDGFNVNNSNTYNADKLGDNITVQNCFARGTGDDGFAQYSDSGDGTCQQITGTQILNNTAIAPYWANGIRIAGGQNVTVNNNLVNCVSSNSAMMIGVFGDTGFPLESATVSGNVLIGGGGWNGNQEGVRIASPASTSRFAGSATNVSFSNNIVHGSLTAGIEFDPNTYVNVATVSGNAVDHPANQGIWIQSGVTGSGSITNNTVQNLIAGQASYQNDSSSTFVPTVTGNSWQLLSQGQPASASSFQSGNVPSNGNDGNLSTRWAASDGSYLQWWKVDLGASQNLSQVVIDWYNASSRSYKYMIDVSPDNVSWTTVIDQSSRTATGNTTDMFSATARYVRITVTGSSAGWASFYECQVYGN